MHQHFREQLTLESLSGGLHFPFKKGQSQLQFEVAHSRTCMLRMEKQVDLIWNIVEN